MYRIIVLVGIAITVLPIVGHYLLFGPKKLKGKSKRTVKRFGIFERLIHLLTVAGFTTLAVTGLIAVLGQQAPLRGGLWVIHCLAAPVFALGLAGEIVTWARDGAFVKYDLQWALMAGGYLWGNKHAPAGRFNGGQKGYLWVAGILGVAVLVSGLGRVVPMLDPLGQDILLFVHRAAALFFVMAAIAHLYLGTFANPGTLGAVILGRVSPEWAEKHHPNWWAEMNEEK